MNPRIVIHIDMFCLAFNLEYTQIQFRKIETPDYHFNTGSYWCDLRVLSPGLRSSCEVESNLAARRHCGQAAPRFVDAIIAISHKQDLHLPVPSPRPMIPSLSGHHPDQYPKKFSGP